MLLESSVCIELLVCWVINITCQQQIIIATSWQQTLLSTVNTVSGKGYDEHVVGLLCSFIGCVGADLSMASIASNASNDCLNSFDCCCVVPAVVEVIIPSARPANRMASAESECKFKLDSLSLNCQWLLFTCCCCLLAPPIISCHWTSYCQLLLVIVSYCRLLLVMTYTGKCALAPQHGYCRSVALLVLYIYK